MKTGTANNVSTLNFFMGYSCRGLQLFLANVSGPKANVGRYFQRFLVYLTPYIHVGIYINFTSRDRGVAPPLVAFYLRKPTGSVQSRNS